MVFDVHQRNVVLLVLVFKNRSSWGWAFVSLIGARLHSAYRFLPARADAVCPIRLLILRPLRKAIPLLSLKTPIFEARRWKL